MQDKYLKNKERLLNGDLKEAKTFFAKNGYTLEYAYCKLLEDDLKGAKQLFSRTKDFDNRALWGYKIVSILQKKFTTEEINYDEIPTFFQLRNFLEVDLSLLMKYNKGNYVEILCAYSDIFASINAESYKFYARAFHFNHYPQFAQFFANKAKDFFYNDPELHYHIALMKFDNGELEDAKKYCLSCLHILKEYFPAVNMLNKLAIGNPASQ